VGWLAYEQHPNGAADDAEGENTRAGGNDDSSHPFPSLCTVAVF